MNVIKLVLQSFLIFNVINISTLTYTKDKENHIPLRMRCSIYSNPQNWLVTQQEADHMLLLGCQQGNSTLAQEAIVLGARMTVDPIHDNIPAEVGAKSGILETNVPPLHTALRVKAIDLVPLLLYYGANIDQKDCYNWTSIMHACTTRHYPTFKTLIKHGANLYERAPNQTTLLHIAAQYNFTQAAAFLLEHGADNNAKTSNGNTPIHNAVQAGSSKTLQYLLNYNDAASINLQNAHHETALDLIVKNNKQYLTILKKEKEQPTDYEWDDSNFRVKSYFEIAYKHAKHDPRMIEYILSTKKVSISNFYINYARVKKENLHDLQEVFEKHKAYYTMIAALALKTQQYKNK